MTMLFRRRQILSRVLGQR